MDWNKNRGDRNPLMQFVQLIRAAWIDCLKWASRWKVTGGRRRLVRGFTLELENDSQLAAVGRRNHGRREAFVTGSFIAT